MILKEGQETTVSLSIPFLFNLWSCKVPFSVMTISEINKTCYLKECHDQQFYMLNSLSNYLSVFVYLYVCTHM